MQIELSVDEVNAVLYVLGEQPSKTGVYPLAMKIKAQADAQVAAANSPVGDPPPLA